MTVMSINRLGKNKEVKCPINMPSSSVRENSQKRKKGDSEEELTLEDLVEQMQAFLDEKPRKRKKEVEFEFHRDPSTGLRKYHHKYRPRSKSTNTNVTNQDQSTASSFEGDKLLISVFSCLGLNAESEDNYFSLIYSHVY